MSGSVIKKVIELGLVGPLVGPYVSHDEKIDLAISALWEDGFIDGIQRKLRQFTPYQLEQFTEARKIGMFLQMNHNGTTDPATVQHYYKYLPVIH